MSEEQPLEDYDIYIEKPSPPSVPDTVVIDETPERCIYSLLVENNKKKQIKAICWTKAVPRELLEKVAQNLKPGQRVIVPARWQDYLRKRLAVHGKRASYSSVTTVFIDP